jgi:hypothetical protein
VFRAGNADPTFPGKYPALILYPSLSFFRTITIVPIFLAVGCHFDLALNRILIIFLYDICGYFLVIAFFTHNHPLPLVANEAIIIIQAREIYERGGLKSDEKCSRTLSETSK